MTDEQINERQQAWSVAALGLMLAAAGLFSSSGGFVLPAADAPAAQSLLSLKAALFAGCFLALGWVAPRVNQLSSIENSELKLAREIEWLKTRPEAEQALASPARAGRRLYAFDVALARVAAAEARSITPE